MEVVHIQQQALTEKTLFDTAIVATAGLAANRPNAILCRDGCLTILRQDIVERITCEKMSGSCTPFENSR